MKRTAEFLIVGLAAAYVAGAQTRGAICCSGPTTELKGKIERVQITPGEGTPFVSVETGGKTARVYLGSIRYLMTQNFNPKVGEEIAAKVFPANGDYVAASVTLAGGKTVRLRDENGRPLWRGAGRGGPPW